MGLTTGIAFLQFCGLILYALISPWCSKTSKWWRLKCSETENLLPARLSRFNQWTSAHAHIKTWIRFIDVKLYMWTAFSELYSVKWVTVVYLLFSILQFQPQKRIWIIKTDWLLWLQEINIFEDVNLSLYHNNLIGVH